MTQHTVIAAAKSLIRPAEGFEAKPYVCPTGHMSIGYGINLDAGITVRMGELLMQERLRECIKDLSTFAFWIELNEARQAALLDLRYNTGYATFRTFRKMIAALLRHDYTRASEELLDSKYRRQVKGRAYRNAEILRTGKFPTNLDATA